MTWISARSSIHFPSLASFSRVNVFSAGVTATCRPVISSFMAAPGCLSGERVLAFIRRRNSELSSVLGHGAPRDSDSVLLRESLDDGGVAQRVLLVLIRHERADLFLDLEG